MPCCMARFARMQHRQVDNGFHLTHNKAVNHAVNLGKPDTRRPGAAAFVLDAARHQSRTGAQQANTVRLAQRYRASVDGGDVCAFLNSNGLT